MVKGWVLRWEENVGEEKRGNKNKSKRGVQHKEDKRRGNKKKGE